MTDPGTDRGIDVPMIAAEAFGVHSALLLGPETAERIAAQRVA
jgi:hypothetical protein